jgi:hypothetical protein
MRFSIATPMAMSVESVGVPADESLVVFEVIIKTSLL